MDFLEIDDFDELQNGGTSDPSFTAARIREGAEDIEDLRRIEALEKERGANPLSLGALDREDEERLLTEDDAVNEEVTPEAEEPVDLPKEKKEEEGSLRQETPAEEALREVNRSILFIRNFKDREGVRATAGSENEEMERVLSHSEEFVQVLDAGSKNASETEEKTEQARALLTQLTAACDAYIEKKNPLFSRGKRRMNLVREMRECAKNLEENDAWAWEYLVIKDEEEAGGEAADDGDPNKKNNRRLKAYTEEQKKKYAAALSVAGAGDILPGELKLQLNENDGTGRALKSYQDLTAEQSMDEVTWSDHAMMQLQTVKLVGFLFGVTDMERVIDPEELLYDEADGSIRGVKMVLMPGIMQTSGDVTRDEATRFLNEFSFGDVEKIRTLMGEIKRTLGDRLGELSAATGIDRGILSRRLTKLMECLRLHAKGISLDNMYF